MCHPIIMEYVKGKALSRRDLFRGSAATGAAIVAATALAPRPVLAQAATRVVDVTHTLTRDFPTYFGEPQFFDEDVFTYAEHKFNLKMLRVNEHTGTHIDAPLHFTDGGTSIDEVAVESLVCPLAIGCAGHTRRPECLDRRARAHSARRLRRPERGLAGPAWLARFPQRR